ncbi:MULTISPECIES: hydantoinase B/oxoprolinase family protein [Microbacterium]|uniref:hydantoinase B/oxoprolinase family protein n=1 Tax=Microbacterium TaxID=33882 RepID=UPI0020BF075B|nr:hydantoinase B/oxoprolinase family protein [Microbacterium aurugineum]MCK8475849.1 hydantoinase B/oxoprolinase family protein [Microbacterium aurugineum]
MTNTHSAIDPIRVEVISSALRSLVQEVGSTLVRAAFSTNIKERRDGTAAVFDKDGLIVAQDELGSTLHLGTLIGIIAEIRRRYPEDRIEDGDVFIGNDPYRGGGSHLPDIVLATPIFVDGKIHAWVANAAHHADYADRGHKHIFQEGLRIAPVKFAQRGVVQEDLLELILVNCQVPSERVPDLHAQMAANALGRVRYLELAERFGADTLSAATAALMDYTERRMRAAIRELPDGTYHSEDVFDFPGLAQPLDLNLTLTIDGDELFFEFDGPDQVPMGINVVWTALYATVYYSVLTVTDPDIIPNAGLHRPVHIKAREGSVLNAVEPAAVFQRSHTCQRIVDLVHRAIADAAPHRVTAASNGANTGAMFSGLNPRTGRYFVYMESFGGGSGARYNKDGLDGIQVHITNTSNLPVEALESEYPLLIERYELVDDSGGAGEFRGGMGILRRVRALTADVHVQWDTTRVTSRPWGLFGGQEGAAGHCDINGLEDPIAAGEADLDVDDVVSIYTSGAGGYGEPAARREEDVERDRREGRFTTWPSDQS